MTRQDLFALTYGPSGCGKTLGAIRAFPDGLFIAPIGATKCANFLDVTPKTVTPRNVGEIVNILRSKDTKKCPAVVVDDFSIIADAELQQCKQRFKGWSAFDEFNKRVYELRDAAREAGIPVVFTMHQQAPKEVTNEHGTRHIPGAPLIPGWQLPEKLPAMADFVARVVYSGESLGSWPYVYQTGPDASYVTKDRLGISPPTFPLNLRVLLLEAGYNLPRPKALQWMDKIVTGLVPKLQPILQEKNKEELQQLLTKCFQQLNGKYSQPHIRWALMDAIDTANLKLHRLTLVDNFITNISNNLGEQSNDLGI
tara:strand:+ start:845 stop:1777 length:933 start_codon:yes stop_codon:yes gene_type:complete